MTPAAARLDSDFPRQRARTRGFRSGAPRQPTLSPDADRLVFCRSNAGDDALTHLWVADLTTPEEPVERRVADAAALIGLSTESVPPAELARRERMRETSDGITTYSVDTAVTKAVFILNGQIYVVALDDPAAQPIPVSSNGPAIDARLSPDGMRIGYVCDRALHVVSLDTAEQVTLMQPDGEHDSWGLADFIAAEEFSRVRGWWWLADSSGVIAQHVDESPVDTWWISDPAEPSNQPRQHRYPAAGRPNATTRLQIATLAGEQHSIDWDHNEFEYLTNVNVSPHGQVLVSLLSRDQRRQRVLHLDPESLDTRIISDHNDDCWVDVFPGSPALGSDGSLMEIVRDTATDTNRLTRNGTFMSPGGLNVRSITEVTNAGVLVQGSIDPTQEIPYLVTDNAVIPLVSRGVASARMSGSIAVCTHTDISQLTSTMSVCRITTPSGDVPDITPVATIRSHAQQPDLTLNVHLIAPPESQLPIAVVWPQGHVPGTKKLPILLAPYGGPHARRVLDAGVAYATDQWWANQGYCVVIIDGRGTPGRGPAWERTVHGDLANPVLDDQITGLDAVLATYPDDLDADRVGIHGWSFGGYLAALAVLQRPDRVHAAVAGAPVTQWRLYDTAYTERYLGDPRDNAAAYDSSSLVNQAPALSRPLLLVHGLADDNVVVAHTLQLSAALLAAGRNHDVLPLSGVTHMTPQEVIAENLLLAQRDFLNGHLHKASLTTSGASEPSPSR